MSEMPVVAEGRRIRCAVGLVLLSPVCAEYVTGYDTSTGDPVQLLGGLLIFGPLYGAPALLIRELSRRFGVRWQGTLALAAALGIAQAGLIDQSLFSESYRDIDYWAGMVAPTLIEPLRLSAYTAVAFVAGHVIWSFCIPIVMIEALRPDLAERPWLRWPGLIVTALLYVAAAALVLGDHLHTDTQHASAGQVAGAIGVIAVLVGFAWTGGRRVPVRRDTRVPSAWVVGAASLVAALIFNVTPESWLGVVAGVAILVVSAPIVARLARSRRWSGRHVVALVTGALTARALVGFVVTPLGAVPPEAKYAHNVVFLVGAVLLGWWAARRTSSGHR